MLRIGQPVGVKPAFEQFDSIVSNVSGAVCDGGDAEHAGPTPADLPAVSSVIVRARLG